MATKGYPPEIHHGHDLTMHYEPGYMLKIGCVRFGSNSTFFYIGI